VYTLRYTDFIMPLVKAMQEQQAQIEELRNEIIQMKLVNEQLITAQQKPPK